MLSGYRIMWTMAMFDLPVMTPDQRKAAARFRNHLLDLGFEMAQYSVYMRFCAGKEQAAAYARRIEPEIPPWGRVHILTFTDKQYGNIITYVGQLRETLKKNPTQLALF